MVTIHNVTEAYESRVTSLKGCQVKKTRQEAMSVMRFNMSSSVQYMIYDYVNCISTLTVYSLPAMMHADMYAQSSDF